ncbi:MAG: N-acetyltransferase [Candidatus Puniceispirillum sp.]|nr:N-acetyltransferase [Candidatus Puniceispirillum sp.]
MHQIIIKQLEDQDWQIWKRLRLEALKQAPECFGSSYEEEVTWPDAAFQKTLSQSDVFGAFKGKSLIACGCFCVLNSIKTKHRGILWGMYTAAPWRGRGVASLLLEHLIAHGKMRVTQLHLTCVTSNGAALALYQKHGFNIYGTEPQALKVGDKYFDEHLMVRVVHP